MGAWGALLVAILLEVAGTTALKATEGFTRPLPSVATALCYAGAFYFLALAIRAVPVGVAYAIWSGLGVVLITVMAAVIYGQRLDGAAYLGLGLIVAGVVVLQVFSHKI